MRTKCCQCGRRSGVAKWFAFLGRYLPVCSVCQRRGDAAKALDPSLRSLDRLARPSSHRRGCCVGVDLYRG
jgi:hypothetical protein